MIVKPAIAREELAWCWRHIFNPRIHHAGCWVVGLQCRHGRCSPTHLHRCEFCHYDSDRLLGLPNSAKHFGKDSGVPIGCFYGVVKARRVEGGWNASEAFFQENNSGMALGPVRKNVFHPKAKD